MKLTRIVLLAFAIGGLAIACGSISEDGGDAGGGADAVTSADADLTPDGMDQPTTRPSSIVQTAGGGTAASSNFRVQLRIGAPQPAGTSSSSGFSIRLGPGATN